MIYPASSSLEFAYDDFAENKPLHRHRNLALAGLAAVLVHLLLLSPLRLNIPEPFISVPLEVTLIAAEGRISPNTKEKPELVVIEPAGEARVLTKQWETADRISAKEEPLQGNTAASPNAGDLYLQAIEAIRSDSLPKRPEYRTFTSADFPEKDEGDPYQPVSYLPVLISRAQTVLFEANDGQYIFKKTDAFGKVTCLQQRGVESVFELINPTLWYRIPASTCGHIK